MSFDTTRVDRARLIELEANRLHLEAKLCTDPQRMEAILAELEVLYRSVTEMRREQLLDRINAQSKPRKRWWRRRDR